MYFYDERLHCHNVTMLNDVAALFIGLSLLATVMFPAAMPKFKGDRKMYRNSANFE
jgi:hypothetical protein